LPARPPLPAEIAEQRLIAVLRAPVADAAATGARYLLAPNLDERVIAAAAQRDMPMVPGAATPSEIVIAQRAACFAQAVAT
jgi:2-keto-3-deoxy-6-phosphogluconate aldolase